MFDDQNRYVIRDYASKAPFSSFLPGIAGELGIPVWCYYNNRGQAVCSFGARDKDHAIMEFSPAHVAYRDVSRTGFRTFCKISGQTAELFTNSADMHIGMGELEITCSQDGLSASALYFGVPGERTAALARILTVTNTSGQTVDLELLDGMPAMVPYGLNQDFLKNMTQLAKAWMQAEDQETGRAYFRVRASLEDGAIVREVKGGNFCLGWDETGTLLKTIVQPSLVFGQDTSLAQPVNFRRVSLTEILSKPQVTSNQFLCCFLPKQAVLAPGESVVLRSIYGQAESKALVASLAERIVPQTWFHQKLTQARELISCLTAPVHAHTGSPLFDAYARQTLLDNNLRGGAPLLLRTGDRVVPFHIYSRKHGDPEREYNYFSLGQEYFAQGNGNYRDVNQNRRCDVLFAPQMGDSNILTFFDLIQSDGYNPLVLTPSTFTLPEDKLKHYASRYPALAALLSGEFTPGQIAMAAEDAGIADIPGFTAEIICASDSEPNADFGEGYWCDHWTYNLDQIETYLSVYPERKEDLLFTENLCRWYETRVLVNPRQKRYTMTQNGLRQYYALDFDAKKPSGKWMRDAQGNQCRSSLMEKILLICSMKTATLDARGMGVEMEGGRPGWYDALNGLPGLFGSSMAETCELARLLRFAAEALEQQDGELLLYREIREFADHVVSILREEEDPFRRWDSMNRHKEIYRENTMTGFHGEKIRVCCKELAAQLRVMEDAVLEGIEKAKQFTDGVIPTYFIFTAVDVRDNMPGDLVPTVLPLFLEGPVRYLKLPVPREEKQALAKAVKESGLYDKTLSMYKVNESLRGVSYEAGRALAFTPGWLENESVWLHMEYKYLLELLKSGLYEEFAREFRAAGIPFLDPERYGRSPLENVSFLASSANPDPGIHGQGFVARLSGSTAEFIHMWQILFFGAVPFRWEKDQLHLAFEPFIPEYLMTDSLSATFLGHIGVTYHTGRLSQLVPGVTPVKSYRLCYGDGKEATFQGPNLPDKASRAVRDGAVKHIHVYMI